MVTEYTVAGQLYAQTLRLLNNSSKYVIHTHLQSLSCRLLAIVVVDETPNHDIVISENLKLSQCQQGQVIIAVEQSKM